MHIFAVILYKNAIMKNKQQRWALIREVISENQIRSQDELLQILSDEGINLTQATLSRDLKQMKIIKLPNVTGDYIYALSDEIVNKEALIAENTVFQTSGFLSIEFANNLAVIKTLPGYASSIAATIDRNAKMEILGTIAGDDTILLIPREGISKKQVVDNLAIIFPHIL